MDGTPRRSVLRIVGWAVAGLLAVGTAAGVGVAFAGPGTTPEAAGGGVFAAAPTPTATPTARPDKPDRHGPFGRFPRGRFGGAGALGQRMLHGEFVAKDKDGKVTTMVVQHGSVTAVSANSVSLKSEDGFTGTYAVNNDTRVRVGGGPGAISGVKTGNEAWVVATKSGSASTATVLVVKS
jgi:hypothetical protein